MKKIAIVHDDFMQWGGAERLVAALAEAFPAALIFTSMVDIEVVQKSGIDPSRFVVPFIDKIPLKKYLNKQLFLFYPMIFESFNFTDFDVVISSSTRFAHGIITKPTTKHISYINSPFRGFWEPELYFGQTATGHLLRGVLAPFLSCMREWDYVAGQRADVVLANSTTAKARIRKYHRRDAQVLHPFVDLERFIKEEKPEFDVPDEYYMVISRLVEWKKLSIAVAAFNQLGKNLIVVGEGPHKSHLLKLSGPTVKITGYMKDAEVTYLLRRARGLIHPQKEDFGMTVIEANSCQTPAIAFGKGGALDTIIPGKTGLFFAEQTIESLTAALQEFDRMNFDKDVLIKHAQMFSKERFITEWKNHVERIN